MRRKRCGLPADGRACAVCSCRTFSQPACGARPAASLASRENPGPAPAGYQPRQRGEPHPNPGACCCNGPVIRAREGSPMTTPLSRNPKRRVSSYADVGIRFTLCAIASATPASATEPPSPVTSSPSTPPSPRPGRWTGSLSSVAHGKPATRRSSSCGRTPGPSSCRSWPSTKDQDDHLHHQHGSRTRVHHTNHSACGTRVSISSARR
jgi:hypothetical protein